MINVHCPVQRGSIVNQDSQFDISGMNIRGSTSAAIFATSEPSGEEISGGVEVDLPSFINLCKRILIETGTLPKWFFFGVIVDAPHGEFLTYFNPSKEKFFSDIYNYIE